MQLLNICAALPIVTPRCTACARAQCQGPVSAAGKPGQGAAGRHLTASVTLKPLQMSLNLVVLGVNLGCARAKRHIPGAAALEPFRGLCSITPGPCICLCHGKRGTVTKARPLPAAHLWCSLVARFGGAQGPRSKPLPPHGVALQPFLKPKGWASSNGQTRPEWAHWHG